MNFMSFKSRRFDREYGIESPDERLFRRVEERYSKWVNDYWWAGAIGFGLSEICTDVEFSIRFGEKGKFEWTEENVRRFLALNDAIIEKENNLYRLLSNVKADIENLLASGKTYYENYDIEAYLDYEPEDDEDYAIPTGDNDIMKDVCYATDFQFCTGIYTSVDRPLRSVEEEFERSENFNLGPAFRGFPDKNHFITKSLYFLVYQETYTLEDLLWLNPDYFLERIEIRN